MKKAIWALVVLLAAGSGGWYAMATATERVVEAWLDARAAEGWLVNVEAVDTDGFPTEFRTELRALELADPATGWLWTVPVFTLTQAPFRPDHVRADWPETQVLASPMERLDISSTVFTSELDVQPTADFAIDLSETILRDMRIESSAGWVMTIPDGRVTGARVEGEVSVYDVDFSAAGVALPGPMVARLDPAGILPERVERLGYAARMAFDRPWDLTAIEVSRPQFTRIELDEMAARWGDLVFRATGSVDVDAAGLPEGEVAVRAENWRQMVEMAVNAGVLGDTMRGTVEALLGVIAGLSGEPENIDATLEFSGGRMFIGPLPIGPAPRLVLR